VYLAAVCGVVHFVWRVKADRREPFIFAAVLALLLAARLVTPVRSFASSLVNARSRPRET
jgi:sulfoxide reductase heme-binding subunit YedZ